MTPFEEDIKLESEINVNTSALPPIPPQHLVDVFEKVRQALVKELTENWRLFLEEKRIIVECVEEDQVG